MGVKVGARLWLAVLLSAVLFTGGCASANRPLQLISGQGPVYPQQAREQGIEGAVVVGYDVSAAGRVVNARVVSSEPPGVFDAAALAAVRSWRFNAPVVDGNAQAQANLRSTVEFRLGAGTEYDAY